PQEIAREGMGEQTQRGNIQTMATWRSGKRSMVTKSVPGASIEAVPAPESKEQQDSVNKELEKKPANGLSHDLKHSSDPVGVSRSRSLFQRRLRHWDVPKEQFGEKIKEKSMSKDLRQKEERVSDMQRRDENQAQPDDVSGDMTNIMNWQLMHLPPGEGQYLQNTSLQQRIPLLAKNFQKP
ncbi:hypothetical protein Taro_025314, partial [Colocasia esculenta]|nr:hypothetical protein [Colocasia esculenta]